MNLKPIKNNILFSFVQKTSNGSFDSKTDWGFTIKTPEEQVKYCRWAEVLATGTEVREDIKVGSYILIKPLRWTNAVVFENNKVWRTNDTEVISVRDDVPTGIAC